MKIEFCTPRCESIPTRLRLKVDDTIDVYYERLYGKLGYKFTLYLSDEVTAEMAKTIVDEIVNRMISQSYDHGAQWRECAAREVVADDFEINITVHFRVRDAG